MKPIGFYWHVHHNHLLDWCYGYDERKNFILADKPLEEHKLRLRLFQPVKGKLPDAVIQAMKVYKEAYTYKSHSDAYKALNNSLKAHAAEIEALHAIECPNCPWDGKTILSLAL
jgi:hypothetical protein